jgi:hypothetical protein
MASPCAVSVRLNKILMLAGAAIAVYACNIATVLHAKIAHNEVYSGARWARTTEQLPVQINENMNDEWRGPLQSAIAGWNTSDRINSSLSYGFSDRSRCSGVNGTIQICSASFGQNDWLAMARVVISGDRIAYGIAKLNDSYFDASPYINQDWRRWTMCRILGHLYGAPARDDNLNVQAVSSCMQGQASFSMPGVAQTDARDNEALSARYQNTDPFTANGNTLYSDTAGGLNEPEIRDRIKDYGRAVHWDFAGRPDIFEKIITPSRKAITFIIRPAA